MKTFILLISFWLFFFFPFSVKADKFFHYQFFERYDPNTEIFIKGKIKRVWVLPKQELVILDVERERKIYNVVVGPLWFVNEENIRIEPGEEVFIKGSKFFSEEGEIFILTKSLYFVNKNQVYHFRDKDFKPLWKKKKLKGF
jgi:hypothetical protein